MTYSWKSYVLFLKAYYQLVKILSFQQIFLGNLGNNFPQHASVFCGVPQCSILGSLSFLIYLSDLLQAVKCDLFSLC